MKRKAAAKPEGELPKKQCDSYMKAWMFTINNPIESDTPVPCELVPDCIWQKEKGADGTVHFQGYLEASKKTRVTTLKNRVPWLVRSHLEKRRGTPEQARRYCTKEETRIEGPWCFGRMEIDKPLSNTRGKRNDLAEVAKHVLSGKKIDDKEIMEEHTNSLIRYHKGLKTLEMLVAKKNVPVWRDVNVTVFWGPTGTGKTRYAVESARKLGSYYILSKSNNKQLWWDGYVDQQVLIMDEFRGSWCPFEVLLRILDGHQYQPEQKGGHVVVAYTTVIITSNIDPRCWYSSEKVKDQDPLFRRISNISHVSEPMYPDITSKRGCIGVPDTEVTSEMAYAKIAEMKAFPDYSTVATESEEEEEEEGQRDFDQHSQYSNDEYIAKHK